MTLDTIVGAFRGGSTAEEIQTQYSTLVLAEIYAVIAFYLSHQDEVDAYLREREAERGRIRAEIEARYPPDGVRGLLRRHPTIDIVRAQDVDLAGVSDPMLLAWAAEEHRILLTHDISTMPGFVCARVAARLRIPGRQPIPRR